MPVAKTVSAVAASETQVLARAGLTTRKLTSASPKALTNAQRAKLVGVSAANLQAVATPVVVSPAKPVKGASNLTLFTSMMVYPIFPAGVGQALFSSAFQGAVFPGAQIAFNRIKKGKNHLVEFSVALNMDVAYKFRVFTYPLGDFVDITIQGPKASTVITALAPPIDEINGTLELGAAIQQRNSEADNAGWALYSVEVNAIG